ncbi:hypothetical protein N7481_001226 [Penicillium waksmanii]|uniref:uncharacterized protein n=1 Tax=Penicillium waksmanii TaxID=69791 RepID=UPI0025484111|nr:uncharacterized protein N7481_001226 [Penicillium waksmanii]KAJ6000817.1 hypothetical protein N7481_001226 [Penicillium waksmanii]
MPSPGDLKPLPSDVIAKIKSSTSINHLNGVVVELVKNALDANARTVLISVDFKRGSCIVEDDGNGIPQAEFETAGGLGKAHYTSKFQKPGMYGHRGLYLASLASLALLTVTSRHSQHTTTNSIIFHHSRPVARLTPAPAHQNLRVGDHGTCVTVNDLFGNMPVRVKSRALAFQKPDELEREWGQLRYLLASLMLANHQLSKLNVTDVERGKRVSIRLRNEQPDVDGVNLGRIGSVLSQSGLATSPTMNTWHVLSAIVPDLTVSAAISTEPSPSKKLQFISLGNTPILSCNGSNVLFSEVNRMISLSDFGSTGNLSRVVSLPRPSSGPGRSETSMSGRSSTKPVNKWPMFYIRIDTSSSHSLCDDADDIAPDSEKSLQRIIDVLGAMILEFLKQQNLRPRASKRQARPSSRVDQNKTSDGKSVGRSLNSRHGSSVTSTEEGFGARVKLPTFQRSQAVNSGQHFNNWSRVKSAKDDSFRAPFLETPSDPRINEDHLQDRRQFQSLPERPRNNRSPQLHANDSILSHRLSANPVFPAMIHRDAESEGAGCPLSDALPDQHVPWTDPRTGKSHSINARTGQTLDPQSVSLGPRLRSGSLFSGSTEQPQRKSAPAENVWVDNLLKSWDNPIFSRTEIPVPNLDIGENYPQNSVNNSHSCLQDIGSLGGARVAKFRGKLRRQVLAGATIISQVDRKFILAKMDIATPDGNFRGQDNVLVLVDQHAADERCRVEQLFQDMFLRPVDSTHDNTVSTTDVDPITLYVSSTEQMLFQKYLGFFGHWGIQYKLEPSQSGAIVLVTTLPVLIAERCRLEPDLVIDLLRREIWTREEDGRGADRSKTSLKNSLSDSDIFPCEGDTAIGDDPALPNSWVHKLNGCPQGIIDLLNSRACRTAIMFNDPLSIDECETIVTRLARCAFPFQCAHGRPSMIPILDLRAQSEHVHQASEAEVVPHDCFEDNALDFSAAFRLRYGN